MLINDENWIEYQSPKGAVCAVSLVDKRFRFYVDDYVSYKGSLLYCKEHWCARYVSIDVATIIVDSWREWERRYPQNTATD